MSFIDLTGQKYGRWTVLERAPSRNGRTMWICQCECGTIKEVQTGHLRSGCSLSCGCLQREKARERFIDITGQKFGKLTALYPLDQGQYKSTTVVWHCICDCGNEVDVDGCALRGGHTKSCGCLRKEKNRGKSIINLAGQHFGKLTVLELAGTNNNQSALWKCKCACGNECIVSSANLRKGDTQSCGCLKSQGEAQIQKWLENNNIKYQREKSFEGLVSDNKRPLRFDFFLPEKNILIEYNGIQHYKPIEHFGGEKRFLTQKKHDEIKKQFCKDNNIKLIEIPYYEKNNIQKYLSFLMEAEI